MTASPTTATSPRFAGLVREYVDRREPNRFNSLNLSWSIGSPVPAGVARSLVASVSGLVADGLVEWKTLGDLAADAASFEPAATTTTDAHAATSFDPQPAQNAAPSRFARPHAVQCTCGG